MMSNSLILATSIFLSACNIQVPSNIESTPYYTCQVSSHDFSACCLGRGGGQTCSPPEDGYYFRSSDRALVCSDGVASTGCFQ